MVLYYYVKVNHINCKICKEYTLWVRASWDEENDE